MTRFALCVAANRLRIPAGLILGLLSASFLVRPAAAATVVRVTMDGASSVTPHMAMGADGKCRLVWSDNRTGNSEIFFTMLDAWGNRLLPDIQVSHSPTTSSTVPRVDVDAAGFAYVCWVEGANIWLARIDPTGHTTDSTAVSFGFNYVGELPDIDVTPSSGLGVAFTSEASGLDEDYQVLFDSGLNKLCQRKMFTNVTWLDRHVTERCDDDLHCTMYWQSVAFGNNYLSGGAITPTCGDDGSGNICVGNDYSTMSNHSAGLVVQKGTRVYLGNGGGVPSPLNATPWPSVAPTSGDIDPPPCVIACDDNRTRDHNNY